MELDIQPLIFVLLSVNILVVFMTLLYHRKNSRGHSDEFTAYRSLTGRMEQELEDYRRQINSLTTQYNKILEDYNNKNLMLADITHEMKMPLSIILGIVQLTERNEDLQLTAPSNNKPERQLQQIKENSLKLIRLVNNVLDLSRIEAGRLEMNPSNFNIVQFTHGIVQSASPAAEHKGLHMSFHSDEQEIMACVDMDKYEKILLNLLSNAIKFTDEGGKICVTVSRSGSKLRISVKDTGLGIPEEMHGTIFERFRQADNHLNKKAQGSGIGLFLVKSFVELHNGSISLKSREGKGSEFIVELPINNSLLNPSEYMSGTYSKNI